MDLDKAIEQLKKINKAISDFDESVKDRAAEILLDLAFQPSQGGEKETPTKKVKETKTKVKSIDLSQFDAFGKFLAKCGPPQTAADKILVAAYWLSEHEELLEFTTLKINNLLKKTGNKVERIHKAITECTDPDAQTIIVVRISGEGRGSSKYYYITDKGKDQVLALYS